MDIPRNDGGARAIARLPMQYRRKPRFEGLVSSFAREAQEADAGAYTLWTGRQLATAVGPMLDIYGRLVGEERLGRDDDAYRVAIRARQAINRSSGTAPELLGLLRLLVPEPAVVSLRESFPAGILLQVQGGALAQAPAVYAALRSAKAAGVALRFQYQDGPDAERFVFEGGVGLGFAGHPTDYFSTREDVQPLGWTSGSTGPVTVVLAQNGASAPEVYPSSSAPILALGTVRLTVAGDVNQYVWESTSGAGSNTPRDFYPDGSHVTYLVNETPGFPSDVGIAVEWVEGDSYVGDDQFDFDVTPSEWLESAAPTLIQSAPLAFSGRVQMVAEGDSSFRYRLGSNPWNYGVPMMKGGLRGLSLPGSVYSGLGVGWPNAPTYRDAAYAWQASAANATVGGRWTSVLG